MTAQEFWEKFQEIFKDGTETKNEALSLWYTAKDYTDFILRNIHTFLEKADLETSREYYRIDLTGWKQLRKSKNDKILIDNFEKHLWDLEVAVEHENSSVSWMDEVVKLLHINCPLRVVIGYLPIAQKEKHKTYLDVIIEQVLTTKAVGERCSLKNGEFMIIIGDSRCENESQYCQYKAYVYNPVKKRFEEI